MEFKVKILDELAKIKDVQALKDLEAKYLSRKGEFTSLLKGIKDLNADQKKEIGELANAVKNEVIKKIEEIRSLVEGEGKERDIDVSLPGEKIKSGHLNPLTLAQSEVEDLFVSLGFKVLDGPELESDYYNFEALNIPRTHPSRDTQDTFYIDKKNKDGEFDLVMRTQTSPVQIRAMQKYGAPLKCIVPGRVFRNEATDAAHEHTFHQIEGLVVDKKISIANFKAIIEELFAGIFKKDVKIRLRPGYFPFVEPGFEIDMSCTICGGAKCPACKHLGWLEVAGAGLVHPKVLEAGKVDPRVYSGFAFGFGFERIVMMKYGINDVRLFESGDMRFLEQF